MSQPLYVVPFDQLPDHKPDMDQVENLMRRARLHLRLATNPDSARIAVMEMQAVTKSYKESFSLTQIKDFLSPDDKKTMADLDFFDQADKRFDYQLRQFYSALLTTRYRPYLEQQFGLHLFRLADQYRLFNQPEAATEQSRERQLVRQYQKWRRHFRFEAEGQEMTHQALQSLLVRPERDRRKTVCLSYANQLSETAQSLDEHFMDLIRCRRQIAEKQGFHSYSQLEWQRLGYDRALHTEIFAVRESVKRYIVPLTREARRLQRRRLMLESLAFYDLPCLLPEGLPKLQQSSEKMVLQMQTILRKETDRSVNLEELMANGYMQFPLMKASSNNKNQEIGSRFSTFLPDSGLPFVFLGCDGTSLTLMPMLQQIGFVFSFLCRPVADELYEYQIPDPFSLSVCEEAAAFLLLPYLDAALGTAHDDFVLMVLTKNLLSMPYDCLVDEFEEKIYNLAEPSIEEICQLWATLERCYLPDLDYEQAEFFSTGRAWQIDPCIWTQPFYRMNRLLSRLTALSLWNISLRNPNAAWRRWADLCKLGGSDAPFSLLKQSDLPSPFDPDTIKTVAYAICDHLSL